MTTETDMAAALKKFYPKMERIENAIKQGTPDVFLPLHTGWQALELKVEHAGYLYFQKSQLAFMARTMDLPKPCHTVVLVCVDHEDLYFTLTMEQVLKSPREAVTERLVKVRRVDHPYMCRLDELLAHFGSLQV